MKRNEKRTSLLIRDTGLFAVSSFGSKILIFLLTPLYTSILTTEEYGIADLITTTINFIYPVLTLAIADATLRFALESEKDKSKVLNNSLFLTVLSILVLLCLYPFFLIIGLDISRYWVVFVITYSLFNIHNCLSNFIKAIGRTGLFAAQGLLQTVTIIICNIVLLIFLKRGLEGYLVSIIIGYCIPIIFIVARGRLGQYLFPFKVDKILLFEMLKYSIPMIPTLLAWAINTSIDKYMIIYMVGMSESGIYSVAHKIPTIFTTIMAIFTQAWQLSAISNYGSSDESEYHTVVYNGLNTISVIGCMGIIGLSRAFSWLLFANDFFAAWRYVPFLTVSAMFASHGGFLASEFRAAKKTDALFASVIVGSVTNIILNWICIRAFGAFGAALATAVSFIIIWLFRFIMIQRIITIHINGLNTVICYVLFIIEALYVSFDLKYSVIVVPVLVIAVIVLNWHEVLSIVHGIKRVLTQRR